MKRSKLIATPTGTKPSLVGGLNIVTFDHTETGVWDGTVDTNAVGVWDWGDASGTYTGDNPSHDYSGSGAGPFTVTLTLPQWADLVYLDLNAEPITSITGMPGATSLTQLRLQNTSVSGDASVYSALASLTELYLYNTSITGDVSSYSALTNLTHLYLYSTSVSGDVSSYSTLVNLTQLYLYNTSVSGDVSGYSALVNLTELRLFSTSVTGDVSGYSALTNLIQLRLYSTSVSGDVSGYSALVNLTHLYLNSTSVSGDISSYSALTSLTQLHLYNTSVSGDVSSYSSLTNLTHLRLYNTNVTYGAGGALGSINTIQEVRFENCNLPTADVDRFLADLASNVGNQQPSGKTVNVGGSNAAPTGGASNADVITLQANGWTVTHS